MEAQSAPQKHFVRQRLETDCGCASLAMLLGIGYSDVEDAWVRSLGKSPGLSKYADLISVSRYLGYSLKRCRTNNGIRRIRPVPKTSFSHWVVLLGDWVYCPTTGISHKDHYPWKAWGDGLEIDTMQEVTEKPSTTE